MLEVIFSERSTNGRWGLDILSSTIKKGRFNGSFVLPDGTETEIPRVSVVDQGEVDSVRVIRIEHDPDGATWLSLSDKVISGGTVVAEVSLQSSRSVTVLVLGPVAVVRSFGYKGRSSNTRLIREGEETDLSPSQIYSLGLLGDKPNTDKVLPEPVDSSLAAALKAAGLA